MDQQPMENGQQSTDQMPPADNQAKACTEAECECSGYVDDGTDAHACATCMHAKMSHPNA